MNLSSNYHYRKYFLEKEQAPPQSLIKKTMSPALANVYFKTMTPNLKVVAGLEPPLKGGGKDWFVPPDRILKGDVVLKPFPKNKMQQWNWYGLDEVGMKLVMNHQKNLKEERKRLVYEHDFVCQKRVDEKYYQNWQDCSNAEAEYNLSYIKTTLREFSDIYTTSVTQFQNVLFNAAINTINETRKKAFDKMQINFEITLRQQSTMLYDRYADRLKAKEESLKEIFNNNLKAERNLLVGRMHDINVEKHVAIEKLRSYLECRTLACQIYVAMKERETCTKIMEKSKHKHKSQITTFDDEILHKEIKIDLARQKEKKRQEFDAMWKKKVCHIVQKFETFVSYCLIMLPEHADFFINLEQLILMQLNEAFENPNAESIIQMDTADEQIHDLLLKPQVQPFYLFCDQGYKYTSNIDTDHLPLIVVNKRSLYSACDNFVQFTDKIKDYVQGRRGEDIDFKDDHDYSFDMPVRYTASQQLLELKLESSLMQVLQQEITNIRGMPVQCRCGTAHCFVCNSNLSFTFTASQKQNVTTEALSDTTSRSLSELTEFRHEKEPKWESYLKYTTSKRCDCAKQTKKYLLDHLPVYMRNMSRYQSPELLNYEKCSNIALKYLVKKAKGRKELTQLPPKELKTKEMSTQCSDPEFDYLCTCLSDDSFQIFIDNLSK